MAWSAKKDFIRDSLTDVISYLVPQMVISGALGGLVIKPIIEKGILKADFIAIW